MSVRRSLAWTYTGQGLNFLIAFGSSIVIAWLVTPREFGIFGMAAAVTSILNLFFALGLSSYIVREQQVTRALLRSAFTVNTLLTFLLSTLIFGGGVLAGTIFGSPDVGEFLRVFAFVPLISMFEFVPNALCNRDMRFQAVSLIAVLKNAVNYAAIIVLALLGFKHMSFAWAGVLSAIVSVVAYQFLVWRPDVWVPRFRGFRAILSFGLQMMSINGLSQLSGRAGEMVLGSWFGLAALGLYNRAANLTNQLYGNVYGVATAVIFSKMAQELRETGSFHDTFLRALRILLAVIWPMMLGLAVLSGPFIYHLYGEKWLEAALPLSLLMIASFVVLGVGMNWQVFVLREETRRQMVLEAIRSGAGFVLFCLGCLVSLPMAAAAKIGESLITYFIYRPHMDRLIGTSRGELDRVYGEALLLSAAAVLPALLLMIWEDWSPRAPLWMAAAAVALGILLWAMVLVVRRHVLLEEFQRLLAPLKARLARA